MTFAEKTSLLVLLSVVNEWVPDTLWELVQPLLPSRSS